jgi:protein O-mannosyl-transferase
MATIVFYFPASHHPFLNYDDTLYVVDNHHIQNGLDWDAISWAFTTSYQANWHPLTWISHAMDVQMFQLEPGGHHVMNLLLHAVNVLLLFWVLVRATGYAGRSAMVAGLFALHPVNVESVAWIAERKNLLSMFFLLLAMEAYRWYAEPVSAASQKALRPSATPAKAGIASSMTEPRVGRYILVALLFALGLMSKPQIITLPFLLLLWDYWPLQRLAPASDGIASGTATEPLPARSFWWLVKEKIPLFILCAASAVITVIVQRAGGGVVSLEAYPMPIRITNAIVSYVRYVGKAFWPIRLAPIYPHPWHPLPMWQVLPALLLLLVITALTIAYRSRRYLPVGWLWFLGALVPMIGIVHVGSQAMADRYAYLPFIGLFIMVCWGVTEVAERRNIPLVVLRSAGVIVLLVLAILTYRQLGFWNDNETLWRHALEVTDDNYIAHDNLGTLLVLHGQSDEAIQHFRTSLAIFPRDPTSNLQIAVYDHQHGRFQEAIDRYNQMIGETPAGPARADLYSNRGLVYVDMQDNAHAKESLEQAVAMDPLTYRAWIGLGIVAARGGDLKLAVENFQHANSIMPTAIGYKLLAQALDQSGRKDEAQVARERLNLLSGSGKASQSLSEGLLAH